MKVLGIDFGTKNIGIAVSDIDGKVAFPKTVYKRDDTVILYVKKLTEEEQISKVVIGMPKNVPETWQQDVIHFRDALIAEGIDVIMQDESFSSHEANHSAHQFGIKNITDASAAAIILQRYLDKQHGND